MKEIISVVSEIASNYVLVVLLLIAAVYFTLRTGGVQFRMVGEMLRLLIHSGKGSEDAESKKEGRSISSFQAFTVSIASRVGTGNLAGVAVAIALGGPGAVFWMWIIALLGAATAFIESTLAQLYKVKGEKSYVGGPGYYILNGLHNRWWAMVFGVLMMLTFGLAFSSVQSNTIATAFASSFGIDTTVTGIVLTALTLVIICGGISSIAKFSQWIVPIMAIAYLVLAIVIMVLNAHRIPEIFSLIINNAFGLESALGGTLGTTISMGIKRGLFSNEAGEGSTPIAAATASVSHPVKQGLIQALGVYTDTLIICSATAFIILCSDVWTSDVNGIELTQKAIDQELGLPGIGSTFISIAIFFFAFTSIVANYYYGEANLGFISKKRWLVYAYRAAAGMIVMIGAVETLDFVWGIADLTMALLTICNIVAISLLGKYAIRCLKDYVKQRKEGKNPVYHADTIPEIADDTPSWK